MTKRFENKLNERGIFGDAETVLEIVSDFLNEEANRLREEEPYATTTIRKYEEAAYIVFSMID